jgi:hypothetical protein
MAVRAHDERYSCLLYPNISVLLLVGFLQVDRVRYSFNETVLHKLLLITLAQPQLTRMVCRRPVAALTSEEALAGDLVSWPHIGFSTATAAPKCQVAP